MKKFEEITIRDAILLDGDPGEIATDMMKVYMDGKVTGNVIIPAKNLTETFHFIMNKIGFSENQKKRFEDNEDTILRAEWIRRNGQEVDFQVWKSDIMNYLRK